MMMTKGKRYLTGICATAGMGGFLFGFDTAVISGAVNFLRVQFRLSPALEGWIMSSALVGCVAGAAVAGLLSDRYGRRKVLFASALLFIMSALGCMVAGTPAVLVVARIVGGVGVGFAAMVAPMFIAELAPAKLRGRLVSIYQLAITLGILCSYLSNALLLQYAAAHIGAASGPVHYFLVAEVWRGMLGSNVLPALLFFLLLFLVPESPRWLVQQGRERVAYEVLRRINGEVQAAGELQEITMALSEEREGNFRQLLAPGLRTALVIGLALPFLSQLTGITTVMYYAPAIFEKAGFQSGSAMGSASVIGFFNMIFTFVAIWKIDAWGRKPMLIWGFAGLSVALLTIGLLFYGGGDQHFLLGAFIFYIAVFAATIGPGVWVIIAEIYPTRVRGRAMSIATLSLFLGSTFVTQTYPLLRESLGIGVAFVLYGLAMAPAIAFVGKLVPETKGRTLEDIERHWTVEEKNKNLN
ncbi:sugar porter family MFS transporter [Flavitalea sp. BT771]|uniref:sugar porter family MFS transporter n=1 Tax=Flavitalea sp. BT771 TaxID=3063329 RepID=UPI0026E13998|nr:sugar porter family MFS transporter [Flavitalea sp. BT771]MDO6432203.1 sugar porter family MFS transporter [Flavitalea sp. BT771]MDV6221113.1 sugar porter family MFS transporter [Flavitalea sp. BT771]